MMKSLLDIHNHTVASGHAFSTLTEMVRAASEKGIEYFGITEHGPSIPGTCDPILFRNYPCIPREIFGVMVLMGCELNILNYHGDIDLPEKYFKTMDVRIAGIHFLCWEGGTKKQNTEGVLSVMHNPWINVITHPGDGTAELDFEPLVKASKQTGTLLEINSASLKPYRKKTVARDNNLGILRLCKQYDVPVILGADAHISFAVGDYRYALPLLDEVAFPTELVMNFHPKEFFEFTGIDITQTIKGED